MKNILYLLFVLPLLFSCGGDNGTYCNIIDQCYTLDDGEYTFESSRRTENGTYEIDEQSIRFTTDKGRSYSGELERNNDRLMMGSTAYIKE